MEGLGLVMSMTRRSLLAGAAGALAWPSLDGWSQEPKEVRGLGGPFRVIDVHAHTLNTNAPDPSGAARKYFGFDGTVEALVRSMDQAGVDRGFLLTYNAEDLGAEIRARKVDPVALKLACNRRYQLEAWRKYRDRFWLFVNHSNALRETFPEDLERDFDQGAVGWKYMPIFYGFLADHPGFVPAFELCQKRRAPVIIDLSNWHIGQYPLYNELPMRQSLVRSFADYGKLLDPIFTQFSTLPICLAHLGTPKDERDQDAVLAFVGRHANALLDTSPQMVRTPEAYARIINAVGPRKLMWGTDWPFAPLSTWRMVQDQCDFLSPEEKVLVVAGNALRFVQGGI